MRAARLMGGP